MLVDIELLATSDVWGVKAMTAVTGYDYLGKCNSGGHGDIVGVSCNPN